MKRKINEFKLIFLRAAWFTGINFNLFQQFAYFKYSTFFPRASQTSHRRRRQSIYGKGNVEKGNSFPKENIRKRDPNQSKSGTQSPPAPRTRRRGDCGSLCSIGSSGIIDRFSRFCFSILYVASSGVIGLVPAFLSLIFFPCVAETRGYKTSTGERKKKTYLSNTSI